MLRDLLLKFLKHLARRTVRRKKPIVVAITGTVGKTSSKEAITAVLGTVYSVRASRKNYNNEWGVPFTVLDIPGDSRSVLKWLWWVYRSIKLAYCLCRPEYPEVLVLEFGIDHPGDMGYLTAIAPPDLAVLTALGDIPVHVENFPNKEALWAEKLAIAKGSKPESILFYNADDAELARQAPLAASRAVSYGLAEGSVVWGEDARTLEDSSGLPIGVGCVVRYGDSTLSIRLHRIIGLHQLSAVLAAVAVAEALRIPAAQIQKALEEFTPLPGRLRLLQGVKRTFILDDTYNASPASTEAALAFLRSCAPRRRVAVLGDMLELGAYAEEAHRNIGRLAVEAGCDLLFAVGPRAKFMALEAARRGMGQERIRTFDTSAEAAKPVEVALKEGDVVLVKGSQGVRMERVVEEVMAEPQRKKELLVRQGRGWT